MVNWHDRVTGFAWFCLLLILVLALLAGLGVL